MNIFELHEDPIQCSIMHCDKHVVKMPTEYAQMLSTAHRLIDGEMYIGKSKTGRNVKRWKLNDDRENNIFLAAHTKHPDTVWVMETKSNYMKLFNLYKALLEEYTYRYGKIHGSSKPMKWLQRPPNNIKDSGLTSLPHCMPEYCKTNNVISAYKNYYIKEKVRFATWKNRSVPLWFQKKEIMI